MARRRSRGRYDYGYGYGFSYTPVSEIESTARASIEKARKKGIVYSPVTIQGRTIAHTWWGQKWCENLERYSDYANRLPRGRRYVTHDAVVDLKIEKGQVKALVQGSSLYKVTVRIDPLEKKREKALADRCSREIQSLDALISGKFPEELKALFYERDGLFPRPSEIHFDCSCPDWASMCKHVAAVMYGIGARLDENPLGFFELRGIDVEPFITHVVQDRVEGLLRNAEKSSQRIMNDEECRALFGVL